MPIVPNVTLIGSPASSKRHRFVVEVAGTRVVGVADVEIKRDVKKRIGHNGWVELETTEQPYVVIKIPLSLVTIKGRE